MSENYEEVFDGQATLRMAPGPRHEIICSRLHAAMTASVANITSARLLARRTCVELSRSMAVCPDLALVTAANARLWLAVEIVNSEDHRADTVVKKQVYEEFKLPRLWMVDPRYDNVEVYHSMEYGLALKGILAGRDVLSEKLLPEFQYVIADLFASQPAATS
jgi:Uma2 family endonuclease